MRKTPKCKNCGGYHYTYQCWSKPKRPKTKKVYKSTKSTSSYERQKLIKELDRMVSLYVRQKGMDRQGYNICYTCGAKLPWKMMDCGHYIKRRYLQTRWDLNNVRPQCLTADSSLSVNNDIIPINEVKAGDIVKAFDKDTLIPCDTEVIAVDNYMPEELYEVVLEDGRKFKATGDHQIVVNGEWRRVDSLLKDKNELDMKEIC